MQSCLSVCHIYFFLLALHFVNSALSSPGSSERFELGKKGPSVAYVSSLEEASGVMDPRDGKEQDYECVTHVIRFKEGSKEKTVPLDSPWTFPLSHQELQEETSRAALVLAISNKIQNLQESSYLKEALHGEHDLSHIGEDLDSGTLAYPCEAVLEGHKEDLSICGMAPLCQNFDQDKASPLWYSIQLHPAIRSVAIFYAVSEKDEHGKGSLQIRNNRYFKNMETKGTEKDFLHSIQVQVPPVRWGYSCTNDDGDFIGLPINQLWLPVISFSEDAQEHERLFQQLLEAYLDSYIDFLAGGVFKLGQTLRDVYMGIPAETQKRSDVFKVLIGVFQQEFRLTDGFISKVHEDSMEPLQPLDKLMSLPQLEDHSVIYTHGIPHAPANVPLQILETPHPQTSAACDSKSDPQVCFLSREFPYLSEFLLGVLQKKGLQYLVAALGDDTTTMDRVLRELKKRVIHTLRQNIRAALSPDQTFELNLEGWPELFKPSSPVSSFMEGFALKQDTLHEELPSSEPGRNPEGPALQQCMGFLFASVFKAGLNEKKSFKASPAFRLSVRTVSSEPFSRDHILFHELSASEFIESEVFDAVLSEVSRTLMEGGGHVRYLWVKRRVETSEASLLNLVGKARDLGLELSAVVVNSFPGKDTRQEDLGLARYVKVKDIETLDDLLGSPLYWELNCWAVFVVGAKIK